MTKLLVLGLCPLPFENMNKNYGPGIRTWQFIQPLLKADVQVLLVANRIPGVYPSNVQPEVHIPVDGFQYIQMSDTTFKNRHRIQEIHDTFKPDAILAATIFSSEPLTTLNSSVPIWIDLFGHVLAEAQAKAFRYNDDTFLNHFWKHEVQALELGDVFSTVSHHQLSATIGELGLSGRLNSATTGYDFCRVIPCAMDPSPLQHTSRVFRNNPVPEEAFVVLWSGGFNTWTDTETLVTGLEAAMAKNPDIWFVSTGGQIDGHDEKTYPAFRKRIAASPYASRFVLRGWVPKKDVPNYYFEADIGINIDRFMYEGFFGSKNRIMDWMRAGLPALTSALCELSFDLPRKGLGYNFPLNDSKALTDKLLYLSHHRDEVRETGQRALAYGSSELSFSVTIEPFQTWLRNPTKSPDNEKGYVPVFLPFMSGSKSAELKTLQSDLLKTQNRAKDLEAYVQRIETEFARLEKKTLQRLQKRKPKMVEAKGILPKVKESCKVTVLIVSWNGMEFLESCLRSLEEQTFPDFEVIVVDNGSTDGSPDLIARQFPDVKLIKFQTNRGFTCGINAGIEAASGDIILLLNQDTVVLSGWIENMVKGLAEDQQIAIVGCKILYPDRQTLQHAGGVLHLNGLTDHYGAGEMDQGQHDSDRDCDYVTGAAFGFKASLVDHIGLFDERYSPAYFEELDFCLRALRHNFRVRYLHKPKIIHYESSSTGKFSPRFLYLYHRNRLKFMQKHFNLKYMLGTFRRVETQWLRTSLPKDQLIPLLRAYMITSPRFAWLAVRGLIRR
jgi:GT2 family glycosyltransferase/glycosyltransferase involved in cell wall biosynthesis